MYFGLSYGGWGGGHCESATFLCSLPNVHLTVWKIHLILWRRLSAHSAAAVMSSQNYI